MAEVTQPVQCSQLRGAEPATALLETPGYTPGTHIRQPQEPLNGKDQLSQGSSGNW